MSPQPPREMYNSPSPPLLANMRSIFSSRWTDADLFSVLSYANGDFVVAVDTILRHEATGQPPGELIRLLSGGGRHGEEDNFPGSRRRSYSCSENSPHHYFGPGLLGGGGGGGGGRALRQVGSGSNGPSALDSVGAVAPSSCFLPPSSISIERAVPPSSTLFERVVIRPDDGMSYPDGESFIATALPQRKREGRPFEQEPGAIGFPTSSFSASTLPVQSATSRFPDLNVHNLSQKEKDELLLQIFSRSRRRHRQPDASVHKPKKHQQGPSPREMDMLNFQAGIEASLKETRNTTKTNPDDDAISYAVKASQETFDEEFQQMQLRNALERKMITMLLVQSLSDPVQKSEEELFNKAVAESLADPVLKSEEQLITEAMEISLEDPIRKSEEELVEEAMRESLVQTMSKEEELVEAVKSQSLKSLFGSVGKKPAQASMPPNRRISSDTSCRWSSTVDDMSECSIEVEHSPPPMFDSSLTDSASLDRKMPAQVLTESLTLDNSDVSRSLSNSFASSKAPASAGHIQDEDNAGANVARHVNDSECLRSLLVEGASLSLVNGVYEEVKEHSKMFTRRLNWGGVIATASIHQTSTSEWVLSVANFNFSPGSEMDVILYTASVDSCYEDLPSHSTNWVGVSNIVQGGSPPRVTEL